MKSCVLITNEKTQVWKLRFSRQRIFGQKKPNNETLFFFRENVPKRWRFCLAKLVLNLNEQQNRSATVDPPVVISPEIETPQEKHIQTLFWGNLGLK